ncbi:MAG: hypothetical protein EOM67_13490 [Spirochaetia bacterium]|nr:hypothetical protein [Spirochaetia bacterium]
MNTTTGDVAIQFIPRSWGIYKDTELIGSIMYFPERDISYYVLGIGEVKTFDTLVKAKEYVYGL